MLLSSKQAKDVVVEGKNHQGHQQGQSNLLGHLPLLQADRFTANGLNQREKQVSPIQNRDRKQIQDRQVDGQQRRKEQKIQDAQTRLLAGHLRHKERSADCLGRDNALDQLYKRQ